MNAKSNSMNRNRDIYLFKEKMCVTPPPPKARVTDSVAYGSAKGHQEGTSESNLEKLGHPILYGKNDVH